MLYGPLINSNIYQVLFINNIYDSNSNNQSFRLIKPIILKIQFDEPEETYDLRFINVSMIIIIHT